MLEYTIERRKMHKHRRNHLMSKEDKFNSKNKPEKIKMKDWVTIESTPKNKRDTQWTDCKYFGHGKSRRTKEDATNNTQGKERNKKKWRILKSYFHTCHTKFKRVLKFSLCFKHDVK